MNILEVREVGPEEASDDNAEGDAHEEGDVHGGVVLHNVMMIEPPAHPVLKERQRVSGKGVYTRHFLHVVEEWSWLSPLCL